MRQLVYGIQREEQLDPNHCPPGIDGTAVMHCVAAGLAAMFSMVSECSEPADVDRLLAYARVVQDLSRLGPVLPMRYGCLLNSTEELTRLLHRNCRTYRLNLDNVDGCVELGVRILAAAADHAGSSADGPPDRNNEPRSTEGSRQENGPASAAIRPRSGSDYLATRKAHFDRKDSWQAAADQAARDVQSALEGCFVQTATERPAPGEIWLASIHFLVRREKVDRFTAALRQFDALPGERLLLTGPWPPYNFVC